MGRNLRRNRPPVKVKAESSRAQARLRVFLKPHLSGVFLVGGQIGPTSVEQKLNRLMPPIWWRAVGREDLSSPCRGGTGPAVGSGVSVGRPCHKRSREVQWEESKGHPAPTRAARSP